MVPANPDTSSLQTVIQLDASLWSMATVSLARLSLAGFSHNRTRGWARKSSFHRGAHTGGHQPSPGVLVSALMLFFGMRREPHEERCPPPAEPRSHCQGRAGMAAKPCLSVGTWLLNFLWLHLKLKSRWILVSGSKDRDKTNVKLKIRGITPDSMFNVLGN